MKSILKSTLIIILCLTLVACNFENKGKAETKDLKYEDLEKIITETYKGLQSQLPLIETLELNKEEDIRTALGYKKDQKISFFKKIETVASSEALLLTEPYIMVLIKVKNNTNINKIKKELINNVDLKKWGYVGAEVAYVNNYGSVILVLMANKELANQVYTNFNNVVNNQLNNKLSIQVGE